MTGGGTFCNTASGSITLSGYTGGISSWQQNTGSGWAAVGGGTSGTLAYSNVTTTTQYRATLVGANVCPTSYSPVATVTIDAPSIGGALSQGHGDWYCSPANNTLTLTGQRGSVVRWEGYTPSIGWSLINNTSSTLSYSVTATAANEERGYVAVVKNGVCAEAYSQSTSFTVVPPPTGGVLTESVVVYGSSATGHLTLTNYDGGIPRWEQSTGTEWTALSNTANKDNLDYAVSQTTSYRVVVEKYQCPTAYSTPATITLYPQPVVTAQATVVSYSNQSLLSANEPYHAYQWYKDGAPISGATAQHYTAAEPGTYFVQVKGAANAPTANSHAIVIQNVLGTYAQNLNAVSTTRVLAEGIATTAQLYALPADKLRQNIAYKDGLGRTFQTRGRGPEPGRRRCRIRASS